MKTDFNKMMKSKFENLSNEGDVKVKQHVADYRESFDFTGMSNDQVLAFIAGQQGVLQRQNEEFERPAYLQYAEDPSALHKVYSGNILFHSLDEGHAMLNGRVLHEQQKMLDALFMDTQMKRVPFTLLSYLGSQKDFVFGQLHQKPFWTTEADYRKILQVQAQSRIGCIDALSVRLRASFLKTTAQDDLFLEQVWQEVSKVRRLLDQTSEPGEERFAFQLKDIRALEGCPLPENMQAFHHLFSQTLAAPHGGCCLYPDEFQQCLEEIKTNRIPHSSILCIALMDYESWLNGLLNKNSARSRPTVITLDKIFDRIKREASARAGRKIARLKTAYPRKKMTGEAYERMLLGGLKQLQPGYNALTSREYYRYMENPQMLKCCFILHCLTRQHTEGNCEELSSAVELYCLIRFYEKELLQIGKAITFTMEDIRKLHRANSSVIAWLVPGNAVYGKLKEILDRVLRGCRDNKPAGYLLEDYRADFTLLFNEVCKELDALLEDQPYANQLIYVSKVKKDLAIMEIDAENEGTQLSLPFQQLKKRMVIHENYLLSNSATDPRPARVKGSKKEKKQEPFSFGYRGPQSAPLPGLGKLHKHMALVDFPTKIAYLIIVLTSPDLSLLTEKVYLSCHTTEFKYIIHILKKSKQFQNLTFAAIGKCGLFVSNSGTVINESYLNSTKFHNINNRTLIESYL